MRYDVDLVDLQEQHAAVVRGHVPIDEIPGFLGEAFDEVERVAGEQGVQLAGSPFGRYRLVGPGLMDAEAGFPVRGTLAAEGRVVPTSLPGGRTARTLHVGDYSAVGAAYQALQDWLAENGYVGDGEPWESYLDVPDKPQPRTEVFFPCHQRRPVHA